MDEYMLVKDLKAFLNQFSNDDEIECHKFKHNNFFELSIWDSNNQYVGIITNASRKTSISIDYRPINSLNKLLEL